MASACAGAIVDTPLTQLRFLTDVTGADVFGAPVVRQQIFDAVLALIGEAREYLVLDFFLFNSQRGAAIDAKPHRELSIELRDALLARKRAMPQLHILVIADPINDVYGGLPSRDLAALRDAGIEVVTRRPRLPARFEPYLLGLLAPDHELVVGRRLGGRQSSEPARCRARPGQLRRLGAAAQFQGQPPQGDHRRRRQGRHHRDRHLRQSARCQQPAFQRRPQALGRGAVAVARERAGAGRRRRLATRAGTPPEVVADARPPRPRPRRACRCSPKARSAPRSCATSPARASATASTSRCSIYPSAA